MSAAATAGVLRVNADRAGWEVRVREHIPTEWTTSYEVATAVLGREPDRREWWRVTNALAHVSPKLKTRWPDVKVFTPWGTRLQEVRREA